MTMHLAHPSLTSMGKRKGKRKFRNADAARKARELRESWENLKKKWDVKPVSKKQDSKIKPVTIIRSGIFPRDTGPRIPSLNDGVDTGLATKSPDKVYTGDKIIGIGTMHKSNAVPIFSDTQAKEISSMRR